MYFLDIGNIHAVRDSYLLMSAASDSEEGYFRRVCESRWLDIIAMILLGSNKILESLEGGFNVLVHCSDGWDRTSQLCSLVQVFIDPFFRTFEGLRVLIEKDWMYFGHMFSTRNGMNLEEKEDQRSPVFTQFLDCMQQLLHLCPTRFEYNCKLLAFLEFHYRSERYGEFMFDNELARF